LSNVERMSSEKTIKRLQRFFEQAQAHGMPRDKLTEEFCGMVGCSRTTVYNWINYGREPLPPYVALIEKALNRLEKKYRIP